MSTSISESGEVIGLLSKSRARVKVPKHISCEGCSHKGFCSPFGSEHMLIEVKNTLQAQPGQIVEVELPLEKPVKAVAILYLIPLLCLLLGAAIGNNLDPFRNPDISAASFSSLSVVLSFVGIHYYTRRKENSDDSKEPRILKIIE